ncbi:MAG: Tm-1-like ATP-binding domain-containing protein [Desulfomonile tiedjei]|nr:Tm-1-like ATP-binding domain-containing protein [Desulfomonile tiedjei]
MSPTIAVVGTLDTKGREFVYLKSLIEANGCETLVMDVGVFPQSELTPDISREDVAAAGGMPIADLLAAKDRCLAVRIMMEGGARLLRDLYDQGLFSGIVSMGGGTGTNIVSGIMRAMPVGVPKLIVSTVAARDMSQVIGSKDITLMHAVADLQGLNFMTRKIIGDAAAAIVGMVHAANKIVPQGRVIGLTSYGPLNQCAFLAADMLADYGYEVVPFHAVGPGSMSMEDLIDQGVIHGVLDLSLHEFADQIHGGYCANIGPNRLETASRKGIPHVILPGGLDMIAFECTSIDGMPEKLRNRRFLSHDFRSFVRSTAEDLVLLASLIAEKLNRAASPPTVVLPLQGWSKADAPGAPFFDLELDKVFIKELKARLSTRIKVIEVDANINDPLCARTAVEELHALMLANSRSQSKE